MTQRCETLHKAFVVFLIRLFEDHGRQHIVDQVYQMSRPVSAEMTVTDTVTDLFIRSLREACERFIAKYFCAGKKTKNGNYVTLLSMYPLTYLH